MFEYKQHKNGVSNKVCNYLIYILILFLCLLTLKMRLIFDVIEWYFIIIGVIASIYSSAFVK